MSNTWSLRRGEALRFLNPDERELYAIVRQPAPFFAELGHEEAIEAGRKLLERLVHVRRRVAQQLRGALDSHHQLIAFETRDDSCPDCELSENEVSDVRGI